MSHPAIIFGLILIVSSQALHEVAPSTLHFASEHEKLHPEAVDEAVHEALEVYRISPKSPVPTQNAVQSTFSSEVSEDKIVSDAVHEAEKEFLPGALPQIELSQSDVAEKIAHRTCAERASRLGEIAAHDQQLLDKMHAKLDFLRLQAELQQTNVNKLMVLVKTYKTAEAEDALDEALSMAHYTREASVSIAGTSKLLEQHALLSFGKAAKAAEEYNKASSPSLVSTDEPGARWHEDWKPHSLPSIGEESRILNEFAMVEVQEYTIQQTTMNGKLHYLL